MTPTTASSPAAAQPAWTDPLLANPHTVTDKARRVNEMFSAIAPSYDLNNRLHSLWMDQHWRSVAVKMADVMPTDTIIDVACGTGDLTLKFAKQLDHARKHLFSMRYQLPAGATRVLDLPVTILGIDFTYAMLPIARKKAAIENRKSKIENPLFLQGDALALPLPNASADILSIAFGIRNVANWGDAIDEFARVLRPGGRLIILEFSLPKNPLLLALYNFYFRKIMPITATLISGDKSGAYKYLPQSVNTFISREAMQARMKQAGFTDVVARPLTFGICVCYKGVRAKELT